jgi:hypothetical protein
MHTNQQQSLESTDALPIFQAMVAAATAAAAQLAADAATGSDTAGVAGRYGAAADASSASLPLPQQFLERTGSQATALQYRCDAGNRMPMVRPIDGRCLW